MRILPLTIRAEDDRTPEQKNYVTINIISSVGFWNQEGKTLYIMNLEGSIGSPETIALAKSTNYANWVLEMVLTDCNTFCNSKFAKESPISFQAGRTSSHVWVHMDNERVLMFYVK